MYDGIITTRDYDGWYTRKKALTPTFHRVKLQSTTHTFNKTADLFIRELEGYAHTGESFQLAHLIHRSTMDIILRVGNNVL